MTPINTATNIAGRPIPVGSGPSGVAITPNGATVYVTNYYSDTVTPIATATNTAGRPIPVGSGPIGIAITPNHISACKGKIQSAMVAKVSPAATTPATKGRKRFSGFGARPGWPESWRFSTES